MPESARRRTIFSGDCQTLGRRHFAQACSIQQTSADIRRLEHRIRFQNGFPTGTLSKHGEYDGRRNTPASDHGLAAHFPRLGGDAGEQIGGVHISSLTRMPPYVKPAPWKLSQTANMPEAGPRPAGRHLR